MEENLPSRRSIRLKGYNYSQVGSYYVTICTDNRRHIFGHILVGANNHSPVSYDHSPVSHNHSPNHVVLSKIGVIAKQLWVNIPDHYPTVQLDEFVIMPNHVHGIITITNTRANNHSPLHGTSHTIGSIIRGYKIGVTKWCRQNTNIYHVWQRNYYERIIRDNYELNRIRKYIWDNPLRWETDRFFANRTT